MAFMAKKKRYKFNVHCCLEELTEVPFVSAVLFAKVRLLDGRTFQDHSTREEVRNHAVRWDARFEFVCKMCANASTGVLEPALLRISVRKECKGGRSYQKLGFCDVNLAEMAGAGETTRRCLLEGYDPRRRQDNSVLRLRIRMDMICGDPLFKVPSPSLKHRALAAGESEAAEPTDSGAETGGGGAGVAGAPDGDDCASSIASAGSSGFGSLTKKRTNAYASELHSGGAAPASLTLCEMTAEVAATLADTVDAPAAGNTTVVSGGTGAASVAGCAACGSGGGPAHSHSRNSSNTSGDTSSKASGYSSSLSQQSQHSRQSSEGGESAPDPTKPGHIRNPSSGSLTASASETGSLDRTKPPHERRKHKAGAGPPAAPHAGDAEAALAGRVENTRVNPDSLIDELLRATNIEQAVEDSATAETSGLQLYIARDGTAELGSRQKQQLRHNYKRVVVPAHGIDR